MKKVICENCGTKNKPKAEFCSKCGNKLPEQSKNITTEPDTKTKDKNNKKIWIIVVTSIIIALAAGIGLTTLFYSMTDTAKLSGSWTGTFGTDSQINLTVLDKTGTISMTQDDSTESRTFKVDTTKKELINTSDKNNSDFYKYKVKNGTLILIDGSSNSVVLHKINKKNISKSSTNPSISNSEPSTDSSNGDETTKAQTLADDLELENVKDIKNDADKLTKYDDNATKLKDEGYVVVVRGDFVMKDYKAVETNLSALGLNVSTNGSDNSTETLSGDVSDVLFPDKINFTSDYLASWYYVTPKGSKAVINYYK